MNLRPSGYEPDELPDCSTPHQNHPNPLFLKEKNVRQFPAATISQGLRIIRRTWAQGQEFTRLCGDLTDVSKREKLSTCWD